MISAFRQPTHYYNSSLVIHHCRYYFLNVKHKKILKTTQNILKSILQSYLSSYHQKSFHPSIYSNNKHAEKTLK